MTRFDEAVRIARECHAECGVACSSPPRIMARELLRVAPVIAALRENAAATDAMHAGGSVQRAADADQALDFTVTAYLKEPEDAL